MKIAILLLSLAPLAVPVELTAQSPNLSSSLIASESIPEGASGEVVPSVHPAPIAPRPLSRVALGGGISTLGISLQAATNLSRYVNLRATGSVFQYAANNISTNGFNVDAKLDFASAGVSLDIYPIRQIAVRLSPGLLFYNNNGGSGTFTALGGTSFTLDNVTYYASAINPVRGVGSVGFNSQKPAFTIATGWGNAIPRRGGHLSFPVEVGVALIGSPAVNIALNSGQVCDAQGQNCVNVATDPDVQSNLQAQVAKYRRDLDPLKTYPIVSFGVMYNFRTR